LASEPEKFGLRSAMLAAGGRLVDTLDGLLRDGLDAILPSDAVPSDDLEAAYRVFVDKIADDGNLITDTAVRRAAARCAERLLDPAGPVGAAARRGHTGPGTVTGELFCEIYALFFGQLVGEFLKTTVAAKVQLAVPILPILPFGAGGEVAEWIAERVVAAIPSPCEEKEKILGGDDSLTAIGRKLLEKTVRRSLDVDSAHSGDIVAESL
jgi:hypothetical protein